MGQQRSTHTMRGTRLAVVMAVALASLGGTPSIARAARDTQKPSITLTIADGAVLVGPTGLTGQAITGTIRDNGRVEDIWIDYCGGATPCGLFLSNAGTMGEGRHSWCRRGRTCAWRQALPLDMVGVYQITATAVDAAGNRRTTKPITVTVLAPCPPCWLP